MNCTDKISDLGFRSSGLGGGHTSGSVRRNPVMGEDVADADVSGERDEVPSTSVAEADTLAGELKAKVQISRRRPDFTLPAMHRDLRLSSHAPLRESSGEGGSGRAFCGSCKSSRRFFCHVCMDAYTDRPKVRLPCRAYFITDKKELLTKATGVQCAMLAPEHVTLCRPHELPELDPRRTALLFPDDEALTVPEFAARVASERVAGDWDGDGEPGGDGAGIEAVVIVDSKWDAALRVSMTERLKDLTRVRLRSYKTAYWRFHPHPRSQGRREEMSAAREAGRDDGDDKLCSAEALMFFLRELHATTGHHVDAAGDTQPPSECHCFDDLLWYFAWQHGTIAADAARREYHPIPPQRRKGARRREFSVPKEHVASGGRVNVADKGSEP